MDLFGFLGELLGAQLTSEGVRLTPDGQRAAVLDLLKVKGQAHPSQQLKRLIDRNPELRDIIEYVQFPGERQRQTPTISLADLAYLERLLQTPSPRVSKPKEKPGAPLLAVVASKQGTLKMGEVERSSPYGWRWARDQLYPVHAEQKTLTYICKLRAFGGKWVEIAAQLDADGIAPPGEYWTAALVERLYGGVVQNTKMLAEWKKREKR